MRSLIRILGEGIPLSPPSFIKSLAVLLKFSASSYVYSPWVINYIKIFFS